MLPIDHSAISTPASPGSPWDCANAGSATSSAPKANPTGSMAATSVRIPGAASAPKPPPDAACSSGFSPGSAATIDIVPTSTATADTTSAAAGPNTTTIAAVSSGPTVKMVSVRTESSANAPCSSVESSPSSRGYWTRSTAPAVGKAAPQTSAVAMIAAPGAPVCPRTTSAISPAAWTTAWTSITRGPSRSINRPPSGAPKPVPSASAPAAAPARPNEPVSARSSSTSASPLMPIGSRAGSEAAISRPSRGTRRMLR